MSTSELAELIDEIDEATEEETDEFLYDLLDYAYPAVASQRN